MGGKQCDSRGDEQQGAWLNQFLSIPLGESILIQRFNPVWNQAVDGFGNHDPGSGRHKQKRSAWDAIHPGRAWASKLQPPARPATEVWASVAEFFASQSESP